MLGFLRLYCLSEEKGCCNEDYYSLNKIKQTSFKIIELKGGYLVLDIKEITVEFALLSVIGSELNDSGEEFLELIFHGDGTSGLRECRHTYWGEKGYLFYMPINLIKQAMDKLNEYFDG